MDKAVRKKLRQVRVRIALNALLVVLGWTTLEVGVILTALFLIERFLGWTLVNGLLLTIIAAIASLLVLWQWIPRVPSHLRTCVLVDRRLGLKTRLSTAQLLDTSEDPFARATRLQARQCLLSVSPLQRFPWRMPRVWVVTLMVWLLAGGIWRWLPPQDWLGRWQSQQQQVTQTRQLTQARTDILRTQQVLQQMTQNLADPNLANTLADLNDVTAGSPEQARRQAIRRLGDLSEQIKKLQTQTQNQGMEALRQALKQLRPSSEETARQLQLALARGQYRQASQLLRQWQQQIQNRELSDAQRQGLQRQMNELSKQLQKLAQQSTDLDEALEKAGVSKKMASLDTKALKEALQKQGLSEKAIQALLDKQQASRAAQEQLASMSSAMACDGIGGVGASAEDMAQAAQAMEALDAQQQQMQLSAATLAEIDRAIGCLGQGMCQGLGAGGQNPFRPGPPGGRGPGSGGPGQGFGQRDSDSTGDVTTQKTKVKGQESEGAVIAQWYFQGEHAAGQAQRPLQDVLGVSRQQAAEAMGENRIPNRYHESIKQYFGTLAHDAPNEP